ncbi:hypothetical protein BJX62DRAFT_186156 [Aspergillus germanicus]
MQWPFIAEVQATIDAWLKQSKPMGLQNYTWDWLTGLAFPGSFFPLTIMVGLLQASPWFVRMGGLKGMLKVSPGNFRIVIPQVSYWRNRSILGRVLAVLPGIHDIAGWTGPCPSPIGIEPYEGPGGTAEIQAQAAAFNFQQRNQQQSAKHSAFSPTSTTFWKIPDLPPVSNEVCAMHKLRMQRVPPVADRSPSPPADNLAWAVPYRATIDFDLRVAKKTVSLTLNTNSVFVAAPPCAGIHAVNSALAGIYDRIEYEVSDLDEAELNIDDRIAVVNATGEGGEAVARAWCSEQGAHAVVSKRDGECCFKCGLMLAGKEGLNVRVLILC